MPRVLLDKKDQRIFFQTIKLISKASSDEIGKIVGISGRSYRYWVNGETLPTLSGIEILSIKYGIKIPKIIEIREENWTGRIFGKIAAKAFIKKYKFPGSIKSRSKGGQVSQQRRKENPEYYKGLGCIIPNNFTLPKKIQN